MKTKSTSLLLIILIFIVIGGVLFAKGEVYVDNQYIQRYNGYKGKWVYVKAYYQLVKLAKINNISLNLIIKINRIKSKHISNKYVFIPYNEKYIKKLILEGRYFDKKNESDEGFIWPVGKPLRISSGLGRRWGRFHAGIDIPVPKGNYVFASKEGKVIFAGYDGNYGKCIIIEHRNNYSTRYAHNSVLLVKKGDYVEKGQLIALSGNTGRSTGSHLHFEIRCFNIPLNPVDFLAEIKNLKIAKNYP